MKDFYEIGDQWYFRHKTMTVKPVPDISHELSLSLRDGHYKPGLDFPLTFQESQFTRLREFLMYTGGGHLISSAFKQQLEAHGITGWKTFPIRLLDKKGVEIPGYEGFSITGRCGPRDRSKAIVREKKDHLGHICYHYHKGVALNLDTWDGSDIFIERYYWSRIISPKAAKVFKKQKALALMPLSEVEVKLKDYEWLHERKVIEGRALPSDYRE